MARKRPGRPRKSPIQPQQDDASPSSLPVDASVPVPVDELEANPAQSADSRPLSAALQTPQPNESTAVEDQNEFSQLQQLVTSEPQPAIPDPETTQQELSNSGSKKRRGRKSDAGQTAKRMKDGDGAAVPVDETREDEFHSDGPFTETEKTVIDRYVQSFNEQYGLSQEAFNSLIQNKDRKLDELSRNLWTQLYLVLPKRDHKAMQRHMRRRFHNFHKRGEWAAEEDEQLKALHDVNPAKWKWIGEQLGRMAEDCRDRWRNYVVCGEARRTDHWDEKEEEELSIAVHECMREVKDAAKDRARQNASAFREDQDWESQINFNNVSAKLSHSRSRLQCLQHWKALQMRESLDKKKRRVNPNKKGKAEAQKTARAQYQKMLPGDKFQMLQDISQSETSDEDKIPWSILAQRSPMKWTPDDWKHAYTRMKQLVDDQTDLQTTLTQLQEHFKDHHPSELDKKYDPLQSVSEPPAAPTGTAAHAQENLAIDPKLEQETPPTIPGATINAGGKAKRGRKAKKFKSAARIGSSERGSPPSTQQAHAIQPAPQAPMTNVLDHPADHFFQRYSAPTAPMSQTRTDGQAREDGETDLPIIRQPFNNDDGHVDGVFVSAEEEAAASLLAAKSMQIMKQNGSGE